MTEARVSPLQGDYSFLKLSLDDFDSSTGQQSLMSFTPVFLNTRELCLRGEKGPLEVLLLCF